jgi:hypothetical protein
MSPQRSVPILNSGTNFYVYVRGRCQYSTLILNVPLKGCINALFWYYFSIMSRKMGVSVLNSYTIFYMNVPLKDSIVSQFWYYCIYNEWPAKWQHQFSTMILFSMYVKGQYQFSTLVQISMYVRGQCQFSTLILISMKVPQNDSINSQHWYYFL